MLWALIDSEYLRHLQIVTLMINGLSSDVLKAGNWYNLLLSYQTSCWKVNIVWGQGVIYGRVTVINHRNFANAISQISIFLLIRPASLLYLHIYILFLINNYCFIYAVYFITFYTIYIVSNYFNTKFFVLLYFRNVVSTSLKCISYKKLEWRTVYESGIPNSAKHTNDK